MPDLELHKQTEYLYSIVKQYRLAEEHIVKTLLPNIFGYYLLQLGIPLSQDCVKTSPINNLLYVSATDDHSRFENIKAHTDALPIQANTIDLVTMLHLLEFHHDPHQVLRECARILLPEGKLIIGSINPYSAISLRHPIHARKIRQRKLISMHKVCEWLRILGFEIEMTKKLCHYRGRRSKYKLIRMVTYFLPSDIYLIYAKKKSYGILPIRHSWRQRFKKVKVGTIVSTSRDLSNENS